MPKYIKPGQLPGHVVAIIPFICYLIQWAVLVWLITWQNQCFQLR